MPPEGTEVFDYWLQRTAVYGLAFLFTAGILLGFLWLLAILVRILQTRLPKWFDEQTETSAAVRSGMRAIANNSAAILNHAHSTQRGLRDLARAGRRIAQKHGKRLGIGSDVVMLLQQASATLRNGDPDDDEDDENGDDEQSEEPHDS